MLDEARSKGNSPPQDLVSARLSFTTNLRSLTTARADAKSLTRPLSISSFELCQATTSQVLAKLFLRKYTYLNSLSDISINDRKDIRHNSVRFPAETDCGAHDGGKGTKTGET
jgi:hypothetical protein